MISKYDCSEDSASSLGLFATSKSYSDGVVDFEMAPISACELLLALKHCSQQQFEENLKHFSYFILQITLSIYNLHCNKSEGDLGTPPTIELYCKRDNGMS